MYKVRLNAKALWDAITRRNLSQNELARNLRISSGYLSQLVCGKRRPSPKLRRTMLDFLKELTFDDLFVVESHGD